MSTHSAPRTAPSQPVCGTSRRAVRAAFTLIELLVVVAIIAILASLLLPTLSRARAVAKRADCASRLKQLAIMGHMYTTDSDDQVLAPFYTSAVYLSTTDPALSPATFGNSSHAALILGGYMPGDLAQTSAPYVANSLYLCPSATRRLQETLNIGAFYTAFATQPELWPTNDGTIRMWIGDGGSYALHKAIWQAFEVNRNFTRIAIQDGVSMRVPIRESEVGSNPGDRLYWAEFRHDNPRTWDPSPSWSQFNAAYNERHSYRNPHFGGGNFAAYDGHVGYFDQSDFFAAIATNTQTVAEGYLGYRF